MVMKKKNTKEIDMVVGIILFISFALFINSDFALKISNDFMSKISPNNSMHQVSTMAEKIIDSQSCAIFKTHLLNLGYLPIGKGETALAIQKVWNEAKASNCVK